MDFPHNIHLILTLFCGILANAQQTVNIAINRPTYQDGTLEYPSNNNWLSQHAVDGKRKCPTPATYKDYSGSGELETPWWQVDLCNIYNITKVVVYGQPTAEPHQLLGFRLYFTQNNQTTKEDLVYENTEGYADGGIFTIRPNTSIVHSRYVTISLPNTMHSNRGIKGPLVLCEVEVYVEFDINAKNESNVAKYAMVEVSSTLTYSDNSYSRANVIDGNLATAPDSCNCCWSSANEASPYLEVILPIPVRVVRIVLKGRSDYGWNTNTESTLEGIDMTINGQGVVKDSNSTNNYVTVSQLPGTVTNITITRPRNTEASDWFLMVCEIEIYKSVCSSNTYGNDCTACGKCQTQPCDTKTGVCKDGQCMAGWRNDTCTTACPNGTYGKGCTGQCNNHRCANNDICNHETGECPNGCKEGYTLTDRMCTTVCHNGTYGHNCSKLCGKCTEKTSCNTTSGFCPAGCKDGYRGRLCDQPCSSRKYGPHCNKSCGHCVNGSSCSNENGVCKSGCSAGYNWTDTMCNTTCPSGSFGVNCTSKCGHCVGQVPCNTTTGHCKDGCTSGYLGSTCYTACNNTRFGPNCIHHCHCSTTTGSQCDKSNGNCSDGCDIGWGEYNCNYDLNIIRNEANTASSQDWSTCIASKAIDGTEKPKDSTDQKLCDACSVSLGNSTIYPWWQVDFGRMFLVQYFRIFGRIYRNLEHTRNIEACISNVSISGNKNRSCEPINTTTGTEFLTRLSMPRLFQVLQIQKKDHQPLTLCEVKAYEAECPNGAFGDKCSNQCHCADKQPCNAETGNCTQSGCLAGWKGNASCDFRSFGYNCSTECHCLGNTSCEVVHGVCDVGLCDPGWQGSSCDEVCDYRSFGYNCSDICHCRDNTTCDPSNGTCFTGLCEQGWKWPSCDEACDFRSFGYNCSTECHCLGNTSCEVFHGVCDVGLCDPGWQGSSCDEVCDYRSFGYNCSDICHCRDNTSCDPSKGTCFTGLCEPGWQGPSCDEACDFRSFGYNCSTECHCLGKTSCEVFHGVYETGLCDPGWQGSSCDETCSVGKFGHGCKESCHCINNTACNNVNGYCDIPICDPGWNGVACDANSDILQRFKDYIKTSMSSVANNLTSDRAVDGNTGQDPEICQCCSGTQNSQMSWWMVEFTVAFPIKGINIYSRNNEKVFQSLGGFQLNVSNIIYNATAFKSTVTKMSGIMYEITLPNILTRYIKIQRPGVLTLCEIQVFQGVCEVGWFGQECKQMCHCANNMPCDGVTGYCQSIACKTGWHGKSCNKQCPRDTFGDDCSQKCYCGVDTCTHDYGICPGTCRRGYSGPHCNKVVSDEHNQTDVQMQNDSNNAAIIGGAIGAVATVILSAILIGVFVYKCRKNTSESNKSDYNMPDMYVTPTETSEYDTLDNVNDPRRTSGNIYENELVTPI